MQNKITLEPIGYVRSELVFRYETPRQGVLAGNRISTIELEPKKNFEQALKDLEGFERIWIIYQFHLNPNWKPLVTPPRHTRKKVGLFATRSPHRPNQIGMSCVKLEKIEGLKIYFSESDILDGSPVLDIKPYLPYSDSFPSVKTGWVKNELLEHYKVKFNNRAAEQCKWLYDKANINLENFARLQLEFNPTDTSRKRISKLTTNDEVEFTDFVLSYRTWRIIFSFEEEKKEVLIKTISSGYTDRELRDAKSDKYKDKMLHNEFLKIYRR